MSQAQKVISAVEKRVRTHKVADIGAAIRQSYFLSGKNTLPVEGEAEFLCLDGSRVKVVVSKGEVALSVA